MAAEFEFDWDEANVLHLKRHDIDPREFEEVISDNLSILSTRMRARRIVTNRWALPKRAVSSLPSGPFGRAGSEP